MVNWCVLPGLTDYERGVEFMETKLAQVIEGSSLDTVFLVEHLPVYTAGTNYHANELINTGNIPVVYTGRGGKFTYHGPGQRVVYPIINLANRKKDIKLYVRNLEQWMINTLNDLGLKGVVIENKPGVWIKTAGADYEKIAAIGVRLRKWVTYHGMAINVSPDLDYYSGIIPCGISQYKVTSLAQKGVTISLPEFDRILQKNCVF